MTRIQEYVDLLRDIIATPSVSGSEKAVSDLLQRCMETRVG